MMTRFSARAWSTALIDFSRDTDSGTMMNGKITRSLSGKTGRTSGILIASSFVVSFGSDIPSPLTHCSVRDFVKTGRKHGAILQRLFPQECAGVTASADHGSHFNW